MSCPECGSDETAPLTIRSLDHLAGAMRLCRVCLAVYLVAAHAVVEPDLKRAIGDAWRTIGLHLDVAVSCIAELPALRAVAASSAFDEEAFRRAAHEVLERTIAALIPAVRELARVDRAGGGP